ncbi:MAG: class I SAM-dependent methyltransferase family protein [Candidatus Aenigmatarchaeota archaeon]|nr:MAG: class I SAM-dependent methyltransferase family protein [Candidatus Aenigmarchaeota archaeon]
MKLKEALKDVLSEEELKLAPRAFDIVGDVAIIEVPAELRKHRKKIAEAIKKTHPRLQTVCNKKGERSGDYRLSDLELILGKDTETEHTEFGGRFKTDVRKAYFSVRESTERQRIAKMIKPGEKVLVMFSGVSPSPIIYARFQPKVEKVYGIDMNPDAHRYAEQNVIINKVRDKVVPLLGDVRKVATSLKTKFDRITMPLPKGAHGFLDVAFSCIKNKGVIHFYHWDHEDKLYDGALEIIRKEAKKAKKKVKILDRRKILPYGPRIWKICVDFRVLD